MDASSIRPLVAGNWKMNGLAASLGEALAVRAALDRSGPSPAADVLICPPATLVAALAEAVKGSRLLVGGQDCHASPAGAHTGDISAEMLKDAGAVAVIVGHSERRADHGERDRDVRAKAEAAHRAGLAVIVCLGETAGERRAGLTLHVLGRQLAGSLPARANGVDTIVAYEPVWAIGTGVTPTPDDVARAHAFLRDRLQDRYGPGGVGMRILYGGSMNASNARELMRIDHVNGGLVGGASLNAADFLKVIAAAGAQ